MLSSGFVTITMLFTSTLLLLLLFVINLLSIHTVKADVGETQIGRTTFGFQVGVYDKSQITNKMWNYNQTHNS